MAELVIGHTTHDSALLWVRGDRRYSLARVTLKPQPHGDPISSDPLQLLAESDYIGVADFGGRLEPSTHYRVVAEFATNAAALERRPTATGGQFHTFPKPDADAGFSFLFASCNLSTSRLESLGAILASALGTLAMSESVKRDTATWMWPRQTQDAEHRMSSRRRWLPLVWRVLEICPALLRFAARRGAWAVWAAVLQVTRFQQPTPRLRSPFAPLLEEIDGGAGDPPAFMIHAGDQIYFDIDAPSRPPEVEEYRRAYRQAWFEDETTKTILASCPHYMILDDHEILDSFANQPPLLDYLNAGKRAYREYVQCRQPQRGSDEALYYRFNHGQASFFVLDTRTERFPDRGEMISGSQLQRLKDWLQSEPDRLKFIVSSVPFVAQLRPAARPNPAAGGDERNDKWCGEAFRAQRDAIIDFIYKEQIPRVIFLVGDMHCTYHATMRVGSAKDRVAIHEIAAGPISQVQFAGRREFYDQYRGITQSENPFSSLLRSFHGSTAAAVRLTVAPDSSPILTWSAVPTSGARGYQPPRLRGYISFAEGDR